MRWNEYPTGAGDLLPTDRLGDEDEAILGDLVAFGAQLVVAGTVDAATERLAALCILGEDPPHGVSSCLERDRAALLAGSHVVEELWNPHGAWTGGGFEIVEAFTTPALRAVAAGV